MATNAQQAEPQQQGSIQKTKPNFDSFRKLFPLKQMNLLAARYKNDCILVDVSQGLLQIEYPAEPSVIVTDLDENKNIDFESGRYLWAIRELDGVHALEIVGKNIDVGGGSLKHSNLTAGKGAHGGGELWYWKDSNTVIVNAHSGRYGDRGPGGIEMAQALVSALRDCGFKAATTGVEEDTATLRAYPDPEAHLEFN